MKDKKISKTSEFTGVHDFLKFVHDGQPEWALFAVKAPIDEVSDEFVEFRGAATLTRDVPVKPAGEYDDVASLVPVVAIKDNSWTIVYRAVLHVGKHLIDAVAEEAKELSARLNTHTITFAGEDTSGANRYELFEKGKLLEVAEWEVGGEFFRFKSSLRKRPELEQVTDEFVDGVFSEHGIYLPACYPMVDEENSWLAVEKASVAAVERADLIELEEEDEDEDEDDYEDEDEG